MNRFCNQSSNRSTIVIGNRFWNPIRRQSVIELLGDRLAILQVRCLSLQFSRQKLNNFLRMLKKEITPYVVRWWQKEKEEEV